MNDNKITRVKTEVEELLKKHGIENYCLLFGGQHDLNIKYHTKKGTTMDAVCTAFTNVILKITGVMFKPE